MTKRSVMYFRRKWNRKRIGFVSYNVFKNLGNLGMDQPNGIPKMAIMWPSANPLTHADGTLVIPPIDYWVGGNATTRQSGMLLTEIVWPIHPIQPDWIAQRTEPSTERRNDAQ